MRTHLPFDVRKHVDEIVVDIQRRRTVATLSAHKFRDSGSGADEFMRTKKRKTYRVVDYHINATSAAKTNIQAPQVKIHELQARNEHYFVCGEDVGGP